MTIGAWWTLFVLTLHTVWSSSVPIALVEALAARRRTTPWLGRIGLVVTTLVYLLGADLGLFAVTIALVLRWSRAGGDEPERDGATGTGWRWPVGHC